jgi:hypothetical protein
VDLAPVGNGGGGPAGALGGALGGGMEEGVDAAGPDELGVEGGVAVVGGVCLAAGFARGAISSIIEAES